MKSAFALLALVALSQGVPLTTYHGERIINGEDAQVGEFPHQVSLQIKPDYHYCGGSILNKNYVITAAHCALEIPTDIAQVIAGTINLDNPQSIHKVVKFIVHAGYDPDQSPNDIALVKVYPPFEYSKTISYIPLPQGGAKVPAGSIAVTSGWGSLKYEGPTPKKLQRTDVLIADQNYCRIVNTAAGMPVHDSEICAYDPNVETGPCHGDSGGALTVDGKIVGIASWVVRCGSSKYPTVYTRVPDFVDWIKEHAV